MTFIERIISVPHSGTRTLQQWIYTERGGEGQMGDDRVGTVRHWHWTLHPILIEQFIASGLPNIAHIPLRNPFDITDSWERRYKDAPDKSQEIVNQALLRQAEAITKNPAMVSVHKIEDLPLLRGKGPRPQDWPDQETLLLLPRFRLLRHFFSRNDFVRDFYREYYSDQELQWL